MIRIRIEVDEGDNEYVFQQESSMYATGTATERIDRLLAGVRASSHAALRAVPEPLEPTFPEVR